MSPAPTPDLSPPAATMLTGGWVDRLRLGAGLALDIRPLAAGDAGALQAHVRGLSMRSRHNRYLGGLNELSRVEIDRLLSHGNGHVFALVADVVAGGGRTLVGEAVYALDVAEGTAEFALSVADAWQGRGIGATLLAGIACRAARAGSLVLHGETLRGNEPMLALAAKVGAGVRRHRDDPRLLRIERILTLAANASPCAQLVARGAPLAA